MGALSIVLYHNLTHFSFAVRGVKLKTAENMVLVKSAMHPGSNMTLASDLFGDNCYWRRFKWFAEFKSEQGFPTCCWQKRW